MADQQYGKRSRLGRFVILEFKHGNRSILTAVKTVDSAVNFLQGRVSAIADLNETHLFNPQWSQHASFHGAGFLVFTAGVAGFALYLMWRRGEMLLPIVAGLFVAAWFRTATLFGPLYGGALVDTSGYVQTVLGIGSNVFLFSIVTLLLGGSPIHVLRGRGAKKEIS